MKSKKILPLLLIFMSLVSSSLAQTSSCDVKKAFIVTKGSLLQFTNKFGDLNVITSNNDSLSVCATITILQDNKELVLRNMKLITINVEKIKDTIYVSTLYDKRFFAEYSRRGRKSFSTDYLIKMPVYMNLNIKNEFGNVSIDELSGYLNANISQGNLDVKRLTRGNVSPVNTIYADHSKISIADMNWMIMNLINCPTVDLEKVQALNLKSSVSKIRITQTNSLVSNSKSDNISIKWANNIFSDGIYSTYEIGNLSGQMKSMIRYGKIKISEMNKNFTSVEISSNLAEISLRPAPESSFKMDVSSTDGIVEISPLKYPGILKSSGTSVSTYIGFAGNNKDSKAVVKIKAIGGKISIE